MEVLTSSIQEFKREENKVLLYAIKPFGPTFSKLAEKLESSDEVQLVDANSALELVPLIKSQGGGLIICHCADKAQVVNQMTLLKMIRPLVRSGEIKIMVTTTFDNPALLQKLQQMGCSDVLTEPVPEKSFNFKIDRYIRALKRFLKKDDADQERGGFGAKSKQKQKKQGIANQGQVRYVEPLSIESDCFLMNGGNAKKVLGRWIINIRGPGPAAGRWEEIDGAATQTWKWIPKEATKQDFVTESGDWVFQGHRPEFRSDLWNMVGKEPHLFFRESGESKGDKFKADKESGDLLVAKDSKNALAKLPKIFASFEARINTKEGKKRNDDEEESKGFGGDGESAPDWNNQIKEEEKKEAEWNDRQEEGEKKKGPKWNEHDLSDKKSSDGLDGKFENDQNSNELEGKFKEAGEGKGLEGRFEDEEGGGELGGKFDPGKSSSGELKGKFENEGSDSDANDATQSGAKSSKGAEDYRGEREGESAALEGEFENEDGKAPFNSNLDSQKDSKTGSRLSSDSSEDAESESSESDNQLEGASKDSGKKESKKKSPLDMEDEPEVEGVLDKNEADFREKKKEKQEGIESLVKLAESEGQKIFRFKTSLFGSPGGRWDFSGGEGEIGRLFAYIPVEMIVGDWTDPESQMSEYWFFDGKKLPVITEDKSEFVFYGNEPVCTDDFSELPEPVQSYLLEFHQNKETEKGDSLETQEDSEKGEKPIATDGENEDDSEQKSAELSAKPKTHGKSNFADKVRKRLMERDDLPEGTLEAFDKISNDVLKKGLRPKKEKGDQAEAPHELAPERPPGPSLGPLALAFLMAELLSRAELDKKYTADRFCKYVSASCGGIATELWFPIDEDWQVAGTHDLNAGKHKDAVQSMVQEYGGEGDVDAGEGFSFFVDEKTLVTAVIQPKVRGADSLIGVLVLSGEGTDLVNLEFANSVGRLTIGLAQSHNEDERIYHDVDDNAQNAA